MNVRFAVRSEKSCRSGSDPIVDIVDSDLDASLQDKPWNICGEGFAATRQIAGIRQYFSHCNLIEAFASDNVRIQRLSKSFGKHALSRQGTHVSPVAQGCS